jgi:phosphate:Na+ symporter
VILFPFVNPLAKLVQNLVHVQPGEKREKLTAYFDEMQYGVPAVALTEAARELVRLGEVAADMVEMSCLALIKRDVDFAQRVLVQEDQFVDPVTKELNQFVDELMRGDLSQSQQKRCIQLHNLLTDVERVGDLAEDIAQLALERMENDVQFSNQAIEELERLEAGRCHPEADVIFTETLRCLERISDHADNLGVSVSRS